MVGIYNGYNIQYNTGDKRVTDIDICFKLAKENTIYVIDSINKNESDFGNDQLKTYQFLNKKYSKLYLKMKYLGFLMMCLLLLKHKILLKIELCLETLYNMIY